MLDTRLIILEGLPATGKTTNSDFIRILLERNGITAKWIHEVAHPHPLLVFTEACMSRGEYSSLLDAYPEAAHVFNSIAQFRTNTVGISLTDIEWSYAGLIGDDAMTAVRKFDTWNFPLDKFEEAALDKCRHFAKTAKNDSDTVYILDSCIFQASIFVYLWNNAPFERLKAFVFKLCDMLEHLKPSLIYSYRENTQDTISYLEKDRGVQSFDSMWQRDKDRLYYRDKPEGADGYKHFLRDYAESASLLFKSFHHKKIAIEKSKADWAGYEKQILEFLELENLSSPDFLPPAGTYTNKKLALSIVIDGCIMLDPDGKRRLLTPKNSQEFYVERLPVILRFGNRQLTMSGMQINAQWTAPGTVFNKAANYMIP